MSINLCTLSGLPLLSPVFCVKTGQVYEQAVIFHHIETTGRCPITNEPICINDCVPLQPSSGKTSLSDLNTVPSIITSIDEEWNDLLLETYKIKHQNEELKQELSLALYQYDAACRTIGKLLTETEQLKLVFQGIKKDTSQ